MTHVRRYFTAFLCVLVAFACFAVILPGCSSRPAIESCDLLIFANAHGTGDTRDIATAAVSLGGVYVDGDKSGRVISVNVGITGEGACSQVDIRVQGDGVALAKSTSEWGSEASFSSAELAGGGFVFLAVPIAEDESKSTDVRSWEALSQLELIVAFSDDAGNSRSYSYRIEPLSGYLDWVAEPTGSAFSGNRFAITKTAL